MEIQFIELLKKNEKDIEQLIKSTNKIVACGGGSTFTLYEKSILDEKINFSGIIDNDLNKIGKTILGMKITPASKVKDDYGDKCLVLIVSSVDKTYKELSKQMSGQVFYTGIDNYIFAMHTSEILACYHSFGDEKSAKLYAQLISWRITHKKPEIPFPYAEAYFAQPEFITGNEHEVFLDCGAYVGDSIERYLFTHFGLTEKIYAFEPDLKNFKACMHRKERLVNEWALTPEQLNILPYGVGKDSYDVCIERKLQGLGAYVRQNKKNTDNDVVQVVAIDDYFKDKKISFIKMDIESYEFDALCGAEKTLKRDRPKLAICIYHNATDMYRIILYIKSLNLGYYFKLDHHSVNKSETVLYAYVPCK